MKRVSAIWASLALLAVVWAAPAGALPRPDAGPDLPALPFPHLRDGNNTTGNDTAPLFADVNITSHKDKETVKERDITLRGTATGAYGIRVVEVSINGREWVPAAGNDSWSLRLRLEDGRNTVMARAVEFSRNHTDYCTISLIYSAGIKDNSGILLSAAVIIPLVAMLVLFIMRRKPAPAGESAGEHDELEKRLGLEGKERDDSGAGLGDSEEVTRLEEVPARKEGGKARR